MVDNPFCELFPCLGRFCNNSLHPNAILCLATPRGSVRTPSIAPLQHTPWQGSGATGRVRYIKPQKRRPRRQTVAGLYPSGARSRSGAVDSQAASTRDQDKRQPRISCAYQEDAKYLPSIAVGLPMSTKHCQPRTSYVYQALPSIAKYPRLECYSMVLGWRLSGSLVDAAWESTTPPRQAYRETLMRVQPLACTSGCKKVRRRWSFGQST